MDFEWDPKKAKANKAKHGVDFELARDVFRDPLGPDAVSTTAARTRSAGASSALQVARSSLWCLRSEDSDVIRIISAREANKREERDYFGQAAP